MKQRAYTIRLKEFDRKEDLTPEQEELVTRAISVAKDAYAPYSKYYVGAALRLENGEIIIGNNQENVAYPSGLCAERVAIFYAGARYPDQAVSSIAVAAIQNGILQEEPVPPCGACRQVIYEKELHGKRNMEVILVGSKKIQVIDRACDLLPLPFIFEASS